MKNGDLMRGQGKLSLVLNLEEAPISDQELGKLLKDQGLDMQTLLISASQAFEKQFGTSEESGRHF